MKTITKVIITGITVALVTACGSSGGDSAQDIANDLGVSITPIAKIDVTRTSDTNEPDTLFPEGQFIRFSGEGSTDPDGSIVSYKWTEGDITLSTIAVFDKSDFSVGKHTVTLTVTDNDGNSNSSEITIRIFEREDEVPELTQEECLLAAGYETVTLSNGQIWLDKNLGASAVGEDGDFYQYGRMTDGHEKITANTTETQATTLDPDHGDFIITHWSWTTADASGPERIEDWSTPNDPRQICPCGFVVPVRADITAAMSVDYSALNFSVNNVLREYITGNVVPGTANYAWYAATDFLNAAWGTRDGILSTAPYSTDSAMMIRCIEPESRVDLE